jgi:hypothetical protein
MLEKAWSGILSNEFITDVDSVIAHDIAKPELEAVHDVVEVSHCLTQFCTSMDTADECFLMLEHKNVTLSPSGNPEHPLQRFNCLVGLTVEVSRAMAHELHKYADSGFWIAQNKLESCAPRLQRIREELMPLDTSQTKYHSNLIMQRQFATMVQTG